MFLYFIVGSDTCTSGFPKRDRLVYDINGRTGPASRLIPEMSFICHGTIVGYTVAMSSQRGSRDREYPRIQIWRRNNSEFERQCSVYYKTGDAIATNSTYCEARATAGVSSTRSTTMDIFTCQLTEIFHIAVQPGDILGLELPPRNADASILLFAMVLNGPTNYVFDHVLSFSTVVLSNESIATNQELPQIAFEFESGTPY